MTALPYWLTLAGYLLAAAVVPRAIARSGKSSQLAVVVGVGAVGAVLLLPVSCRSLMMRMCDTGSTPLDCDPSGDRCSTLIGLDVPYADAMGIAGTRAVGGALIIAGIAVAALTMLWWNRRLTGAGGRRGPR